MVGVGLIDISGTCKRVVMAPEVDQTPQGISEDSTHHRVVTNTVLLVGLRVLMPMLSVALILALSRYLGAEGLGRYTLAFSVLYVFNAIAPLGLSSVITRECARDPDRLHTVLGNALTVGTMTSLVCIPLMISAGFMLGYEHDTRTALNVLSAAVLPFTIGTMLESAFIAKERIDLMAIGAFVENALKVGVGVVLLYLGYGLQSVLIMAVFGRIVSCLLSIYLLRRIGVKVSLTSDAGVRKQLLKLAPTFFFIGVFATLYWRIDIFMLSTLKPVTEVGYYGAAYRLLELAMIFPQSLCLAIYPQIVSATHTNLTALNKLGQTSSRYLAAVSLPVVICTVLLAEPILVMLYGESFRVAAPTLAVLMLTLLPYSIVRYHAYVLVGANRQHVDLWLNVVMALLNILLNLVLIPRYSYFGAALATFIAVCIYAILQYSYVRIKLSRHAAPLGIQSIVVVASALIGIGVWWLRDVNVLGLSIVSGIAYLTLLYVGGFFTRSELQLFGVGRMMDRLGIR